MSIVATTNSKKRGASPLLSSRTNVRDLAPVSSRSAARDLAPVSSRSAARDLAPVSSRSAARDLAPVSSRSAARDLAFSHCMNQTKTQDPSGLRPFGMTKHGVVPNEREGPRLFALHEPNQNQDPSGLQPFGMTCTVCTGPFGMTRIECTGPPGTFVVPNAPKGRRDLAFLHYMSQTKPKIPPAFSRSG